MISQRKAGAIFGYANILTKNIVNLIYTPMLLSFIGQADYGVFQTSNSFVFSLSLLTFGFSGAYVRFFTQYEAHGTDDDICNLNGLYLILYALVSAAALVLGLLFAGNVGLFFSESFTPDQISLAGFLMAVMAVNIAVTLFSTVFDSYILARERLVFQQSRQLFTSLATPFLAFLLLVLGMGAVGVALAQLFVSIVLLALNARFAIHRLGMRFNLGQFDWVLFRALVAFSGWLFANQVCDLVNQSVPNMLLGALTSASIVAVFAVAVQVRNVFVSLSTALSNVFVPKINRIVAASDDNTELTALMATVGRYQMVVFCWVYGGFALLGRFFVANWAGEGFMESYWLILAMTLPLVLPLTQNTGIEIQRAKNRHKARSVVMLIMALFNVVFTWAMSPVLQCWAPAIGYITSISLGNGLFMNWYYHYRIGLDIGYFWRRNLPVLGSSTLVTVACLLVSTILKVESWLTFCLWGLAYSALFIAALWHFVADDSEKDAARTRLPFLG